MEYLPAQLESLFAQDLDGELKLLVRDDGSTDGTADYIAALDDPRIVLVRGENLGPRGSFYDLLRRANEEDAGFFALCDQDDVWHSNKLRYAISTLEEGQPSLYASSLNLVDQDLNPLQTFTHPGNASFASALVSNFVTGCTCVFNRAFLDRLPFPADPERTIMHDWWLANVATLESRIFYDRRSHISYRQHASNHIGLKTGAVAVYRKLRRALLETPQVTRFDHVRQFALAAGDRFDARQNEIVAQFLSGQQSWLRRLNFVFKHRSDLSVLSALRFVLFR